MTASRLLTPLLFLLALLTGCSQAPSQPSAVASVAVCPPPAPAASCPPCPTCPVCPACPTEPVKLAEPSLQAAQWSELTNWEADELLPVFNAFRDSCRVLQSQPRWRAVCHAAQQAKVATHKDARVFFEAQFAPWAVVAGDGTRSGMVTGYYEPLLRGSRQRKPPYTVPVFGPPEDMIIVDLASLYPELKSLRLRGRLEGRRLVPYLSRAEWSHEEAQRQDSAILWLDDPIDFFFMQIQGSGQVQLDDGRRIRLGYADQNGHPYRSIGRWLIDQGELKAEQASMQGIKAWARANPHRLQELLNINPSVVFFRELPAEGSGPPGSLGVPLTPGRSIAVDPRYIPLGAPVFLATTWPNENRPLQRLMLAQDTGGAIKGAPRADFYWGSGDTAGELAGRMRQTGSQWVLLPRGWPVGEKP